MHENKTSSSANLRVASRLLLVAMILWMILCSATSMAGSVKPHDGRQAPEKPVHGNQNGDGAGGDDSSSWSLIDWALYKQKFGKNYSSLSQQLLRQKIFMSKQIQVFFVWTNFSRKRKSYFISINQFSDLTQEEEQYKLSGDGGEYASDDDDDDIMDDEQARRALLEALEEDQQEADTEPRRGRRPLGRHKRSLMTDLIAKNLDFNLVRLPSSTNVNAAELNIKWVVPSNNPDYQQVEALSLGVDSVATREAPDIPKEDVEEIVANSSTWLALRKLIGDTARNTVKWIRSNSFKRKGAKQESSKPDHSASVSSESERRGAPSPRAISEDTVLVDWRRSGCVAPPINQGECNSCYSVSSMAFLEWAFCMNQNRALTPLSIQYLVSCGPQYRDESDPNLKIQFYGCERGRSRQAMSFVKDYGVELAAHMPYLGRDAPCPVERNTPLKHKGYIRPNVKQHVRMAASTKQLELALKVGPVIVNFREPMDFLAYGGGMVGRCYQRGGHAMLVVGHGVENGTPYLLIKNSFGTEWGMGGYFKFNRNHTEECVKDFILPRVSFPSKKAQSRRMKAYLAGQQADTLKPNLASSTNDLEGIFDVGAGGLFS